jgi:putative phage-type endonuclease
MKELVAEALTGEVDKIPVNEHMLRGTRLEPVAFKLVETKLQEHLAPEPFKIDECGSCFNTDRPWLAASPDGLTSDNHVLEIKCPMLKNHMASCRNGMPKYHLAQIYAEMYATDRQGTYFASYSEEAEEAHRIYIQQIPRDKHIEKEFLAAADSFANDFRKKLVGSLEKKLLSGELEPNTRLERVLEVWQIDSFKL